MHGFDDKTEIHFLQRLQRTFLLSEDEAINQLRAILAKQLKLLRLATKLQLSHVAKKPTIRTANQVHQTDLAQCLVLPKPTYNAKRKGAW